MNIKKLLITGATAALVFGTAAGAFAGYNNNCERGCGPTPTPVPVSTTKVTNNGGVDNTSVNVANTGLNSVTGSQQNNYRHHGGDSKTSSVTVTTGAASATQYTTNGINTTVVGCGCATTGISTTTVKNNGSVSNLSVNVANTGLNRVSGGLSTGGATAGQGVSNVINTGVSAL